MLVVAAPLVRGIPPTITEDAGDPLVFSPDWLASFNSGNPGCNQQATDSYTWRQAGLGSNINSKFRPHNECVQKPSS